MGRLTTHVLDTAAGKPASGLRIELWSHDGDPVLLNAIKTNDDGRADKPLLEGASFRPGTYELRFFAGEYLRTQGSLPEPPFLDVIPIRFGVSNSDQHYHVPLLLSAYGYSTYRGS
ncbi:hydroxyisourate hydrolase [Breoghania sp.]|uniref:hydroxyisourate hydrolase n=1 Tax=Breoghania sp. TaxID=2065378 RepID=UPI002AA7C5A4|nr:hydroxyisourate hydrolase [Breoghania sp.]